MSTKGTVAFTTWDGELEAAVYVHNAGHFTPEVLAEFFAAVARDCGPVPHDLRFHHPSYLAAVAKAVTAERERIRSAAGDLKFTLFRPGNGPAQTEALDVVPLTDLLRLLEGGG